MFLIFPVGSEKGVRRLPYVTIGLIAVNTIIWVFTSLTFNGQIKQIEELNARLYEIERRYSFQVLEKDPDLLTTFDPVKVHQKFAADSIIPEPSPDFREWQKAYEQFNSARRNIIFEKVGFKPKQFDMLKLFTALFVHGNLFHLVFNMLFLWLVGCNIEDDWGWKVFLGLYLVSGVVATMSHTVVAPQSDMPLIGASGAIAGVMGAFMIRHFKTKVRFAYFFWFLLKPYFGTFAIYAGVALPFWFLEQILSASWSMSMKGSGTAYWAHVGGFVFGAMVGLSMKFLGWEKKYVVPMVEDSFEKLKLSYVMKEANKKLEAGDTTGAIPLFLQAIEEDPQNIDASLILARLFFEKGQLKDSQIMFDKALGSVLMKEDGEWILSIYDEIIEKKLLEKTAENNLYRLAAFLEKAAKCDEALRVYDIYVSTFPAAKLRPKAIYRMHILYKTKLNDAARALTALNILQKEYPEWMQTMQ